MWHYAMKIADRVRKYEVKAPRFVNYGESRTPYKHNVARLQYGRRRCSKPREG